MAKRNLNAIEGQLLNAQTGLLANTPTADTVLFNITGSVRILEISGVVKTTAMQAQATGILLKVTVDALAATDICAVLDATGDTVGTSYNITGTLGDALVASAVGVKIGQAGPVDIDPITSAILELENAGAANNGQTFWNVLYQACSPGARMLAAF